MGSASVTLDSNGDAAGEQRYYPFGETRLSIGTIPTDRLFTGQRELSSLGIYHYGARFYSPTLMRFISADTIVPGSANPQAFNRYAYVLNNPLKYTDPTGHYICDAYCVSWKSAYRAAHPNGGNGGHDTAAAAQAREIANSAASGASAGGGVLIYSDCGGCSERSITVVSSGGGGGNANTAVWDAIIPPGYNGSGNKSFDPIDNSLSTTAADTRTRIGGGIGWRESAVIATLLGWLLFGSNINIDVG